MFNELSFKYDLRIDDEMENFDFALQSHTQRLEKLITEFIENWRIPGLSIAISDESSTLYSKAFGVSNRKSGTPFRKSTISGVASISKSLTALTIYKLNSTGRLSLTDRVKKYIPELALDTDENPVTIKQLLSHSTGIGSLNTTQIYLMQSMGKDTTNIQLKNFKDFIEHSRGAESQRFSPPDSRHLYWNEGYTILGEIIRRVSGMPYSSFAEEELLKPLGMKCSGFKISELCPTANISSFYSGLAINQEKEVDFPQNELNYATGGLLSNIDDMSKYLRFWIKSNRKGEKTIQDWSFAGEALKPRISKGITNQFGLLSYGSGWEIFPDFFGETMYQHPGDIYLCSSCISFLPDRNIGVVVLANKGSIPQAMLTQPILALLLGRDPNRDFDYIRENSYIESILGNYKDYRGYSDAEVYRKSGNLFLSITSDVSSFDLPVFYDQGEFYAILNSRKLNLRFVKHENGIRELFFDRGKFVSLT